LKNLSNIIWNRVSKDFITKNRLEATEGDIIELQEFNKKFQGIASNKEKEGGEICLESKKYEFSINRRLNKKVIERWKIYEKLYETYGGVVSATKTGFVPTEAIKSLFLHYQEIGFFRIYDEELNKEFWEMHSEVPNYIASKEKIDFTPYWKNMQMESDSK
jgi:hypothetical protein